jgi:hypothetical protein
MLVTEEFCKNMGLSVGLTNLAIQTSVSGLGGLIGQVIKPFDLVLACGTKYELRIPVHPRGTRYGRCGGWSLKEQPSPPGSPMPRVPPHHWRDGTPSNGSIHLPRKPVERQGREHHGHLGRRASIRSFRLKDSSGDNCSRGPGRSRHSQPGVYSTHKGEVATGRCESANHLDKWGGCERGNAPQRGTTVCLNFKPPNTRGTGVHGI